MKARCHEDLAAGKELPTEKRATRFEQLEIIADLVGRPECLKLDKITL